MPLAGNTAGVPAIGEPAPELHLPDPGGRWVTLGELRRAGPVWLEFLRGLWCVDCRLRLLLLRQEHARVRREGATLAAVVCTSPGEAAAAAREQDLPFPLLADETGEAARAYGVWQPGGPLPAARPATFVVDGEGRVQYAYVGVLSTDRPGVDGVLYKLYKLRRLRERGSGLEGGLG